MKIKLKIEKEYDVRFISVSANVRYWDYADVFFGGMPISHDEIPCKNGDNWDIDIDIEEGRIVNWTEGFSAKVYFKVCDQCSYILKDDDCNFIAEEVEVYVPDILCPKDSGYGDYIIMDIDENGVIDKFNNSKLSEIQDRINED